MKLFLKGDRCYTDKCAFDRRQYAPGQHGQGRHKYSDYGAALREKQKVKRIYGVLEKQFRRYFALAERMKGMTGANLLMLLERRLDNVVYRAGFADSRDESRQLVKHGHFLVNGKRVDVPNYIVNEGDVISVREKSKKLSVIKEALEAAERRQIPDYLSLDKEKMSAKVVSLPTREHITVPIEEQLIVELYSK